MNSLLRTTVINHELRKEWGLSCNEWCFIDIVYKLSDSDTGWCMVPKVRIAEAMNVTKAAVLKMIDRLAQDGLLVVHNATHYIRLGDLLLGLLSQISDEPTSRGTLFSFRTGQKLPNFGLAPYCLWKPEKTLLFTD